MVLPWKDFFKSAERRATAGCNLRAKKQKYGQEKVAGASAVL